MRTPATLLGSLPVFLAFVCASAEAGTVNERMNLRFVDDLRVVVGPIPPELRRTGLRSHLLESEIETTLRRDGIEIDDESENRLEVGFAGIRARNDGFYVFSLRVKLAQQVVPLSVLEDNHEPNPVDRFSREVLSSYVWDSGATGYLRLYADPSRVIREALFQKVGEFADDFHLSKGDREVSPTDEVGPGSCMRKRTSEGRSDEARRISIKNEGTAIVVYDATGIPVLRSASPKKTRGISAKARGDILGSMFQGADKSIPGLISSQN